MYMKNMFTLNEKEKKQIIEMHNNYKKLLNEQEVKQGGKGDPYQYKKEGDRYFYAKKKEGATASWIERTDKGGHDAIQSEIFVIINCENNDFFNIMRKQKCYTQR